MKKDYMARLERAARWRLPRQEAEDVIADYRDIVGNPPRTEEQLRREVGDPEQVVKLLVSPPKAYRAWLAAFWGMAACIALPALGPWPFEGLYFPELFGDFPTWNLYFRPLWELFISYHSPFPYLYLIVGLAAALVWFRRPKGGARAPLPRIIPIWLAVTAVPLAAIWWLLLQMDGFPDALLWRLLADSSRHIPLGPIISLTTVWVCFALAILGVAALVKARTGDRRWRAVYAMALTAVIVCLSVIAILNNMEIVPTAGPHPLRDEIVHCSILTAIGLLGTGVALC